MQLKLYSAPQTCSMAAHMILEMSGKPYLVEKAKLHDSDNKVEANFRETLQWDYKVPVLVTESGVLTQNAAILLYLAEKFKELKLLGNNDFERAKIYEWLGFINSDIHPIFMLLFQSKRFVDSESAVTELKAQASKRVEFMFKHVEKLLEGKKYSSGEQLCVADPYLYIVYRWAVLLKLPFLANQLPNYRAYVDRMQELPVVRKVLEDEKVALV